MDIGLDHLQQTQDRRRHVTVKPGAETIDINLNLSNRLSSPERREKLYTLIWLVEPQAAGGFRLNDSDQGTPLGWTDIIILIKCTGTEYDRHHSMSNNRIQSVASSNRNPVQH